MLTSSFLCLWLVALLTSSLSGLLLVASAILGRRAMFEKYSFSVSGSAALQLLALCGWYADQSNASAVDLTALAAETTLLAWTTVLLISPLRRWIWSGVTSRESRRLYALVSWQLAMIACAHWGFFQAIVPKADNWEDSSPGLRQVRQVPGASLVTDRGRRISVFQYELPDVEMLEMFDHREEFGERLQLQSPADPTANCHGWVFARGEFAVHCDNVEAILQDNNYSIAAAPRPGDLIVYRGEAGEVLHSGLVRKCVGSEIFIESKWGVGARYLHRVEDQVYSQYFQFYRSPRGGHTVPLVAKSGPVLVATLATSAPVQSLPWRALQPPPALPSSRRPERS